MVWEEAQPAKGLRMPGPESGSPVPRLGGGSGHSSIRKLGKATPGQAASVSSRAQQDRLLPQLMTWRPLQRTPDVSFWPLHSQHTHALPCTPHNTYILHTHTHVYTHTRTCILNIHIHSPKKNDLSHVKWNLFFMYQPPSSDAISNPWEPLVCSSFLW